MEKMPPTPQEPPTPQPEQDPEPALRASKMEDLSEMPSFKEHMESMAPESITPETTTSESTTDSLDAVHEATKDL